MIYLSLPHPRPPRRLPFFLAMEEWIADALPDGEYFFIWQQAKPTIICGRNQIIPLEVDMELCRRLGIDVVRRRSGGGAVVADDNNLMLSYVCPRGGQAVDTIFSRWSHILATALSCLGLAAEASGRNDICIRGKKVSGGAFYALPKHAIAHSTLLYRLPPAELTSALTPDRAKLESKGVKSVASRISSLTDEGLRMEKHGLVERLQKELCEKTIELTPDDVRAIEAIESRYYEPSFLRLENSGKFTRKVRSPQAGAISADFRLDREGRIRNLTLNGDFFATENTESLCRAIEGLTPAELRLKAGEIKAERYISGLDSPTLISLFTEP